MKSNMYKELQARRKYEKVMTILSIAFLSLLATAFIVACIHYMLTIDCMVLNK